MKQGLKMQNKNLLLFKINLLILWHLNIFVPSCLFIFIDTWDYQYCFQQSQKKKSKQIRHRKLQEIPKVDSFPNLDVDK